MGSETENAIGRAPEKRARARKRNIMVVWMLVAAGFGWADYITGPDFSFAVFYMLPVCLVTWQVGVGAGLVIAFYCGALWLVADLAVDHYYRYALAPYWNALTRVVFF